MKHSIIHTLYQYRAAIALFVVLSILAIGLASSDVSATGQSIAERNVQLWISQLSQDPSAPLVRQAQSKLEESGETAVDGLTQSLGSQNPLVRRNAAEVLGYIGSPRALNSLAIALARDTDPGVRTEAAWALSGLNTGMALNPLERASLLDSDAHVRQAAAQAIEQLRWTLAQLANQDPKLVDALAVAPSHQNTVYLAVENQIIKSENGGRLWIVAGEMPSRVLALTVSPSDPGVLYAGTESNALFTSIDGGLTWTAVGGKLGEGDSTPVSVTAIAIDPGNSGRIFVAKGTSYIGQVNVSPLGVALSQDGGNTWQGVDLADSPDPVSQLLLNGNVLYGRAGDRVYSSPLTSN